MKVFSLFIAIFCSSAYALDVMVISDLNGSYGTIKYSNTVKKSVQDIINKKPDLVLITGDMVAGMKHGLDYKSMWNEFNKAIITPIKKAGINIAVTPGNHDASAYSSFAEERNYYRNNFLLEKSNLKFLDASSYPFHYSFSKSNSLFISLDVTMPGKLLKSQFKWLKNQLSLYRDQFTHAFIFSHLPIYPVAQKREKDAMFDEDLMQLLREYNVKFYLSGHQHAFYYANSGGVSHLGQGCLGSGSRKWIGTNRRSPKTMTLLEIDLKVKVSALMNSDFKTLVETDLLPESIKVNDEVLLTRLPLNMSL
ncbi:MAG: 3',5'-cyclic AMP phosphodiesterase CpdA [Thermoproteota archaeon]|jgi:3',5'-cyclic AMP phosphodiesterase CpdA